MAGEHFLRLDDAKLISHFLDTQVSLAPTHVSPLAGGRSVILLVRLLLGPSVGDTFEFPKSIFAKCTQLACLRVFSIVITKANFCYQLRRSSLRHSVKFFVYFPLFEIFSI